MCSKIGFLRVIFLHLIVIYQKNSLTGFQIRRTDFQVCGRIEKGLVVKRKQGMKHFNKDTIKPEQ
jgi:hypothetical protein